MVTSNWTVRESAQYHSPIASRLKAAVHVHISAPDARGKVGGGSLTIFHPNGPTSKELVFLVELVDQGSDSIA